MPALAAMPFSHFHVAVITPLPMPPLSFMRQLFHFIRLFAASPLFTLRYFRFSFRYCDASSHVSLSL
jgi:hypothetical protein